ncbi:MAG: hypothetical protein AB1347_01425 [Acidobacteriota bacterium]
MNDASWKRVLLVTCTITLAALGGASPETPFREAVSGGSVDWDEGWIHADAEVPMPAPGPSSAQARVDARRIAVLKAQAAALRIAMRLPVDSERRLESFEALRSRVRGIVSGGRILSEEERGGRYALTLGVPINGVRGIASEVALVTLPPPPVEPSPRREMPPSAPSPRAEPAPPPPRELSSFATVTVDAREAGVRPALQPRILDPSGREVYGIKTIKPLRAKEGMLARYVTRPATTGGGFRLTDLFNSPALPLALVAVPGREWAQRQAPVRPRGQESAIEVKAVGASGSLGADILVTEDEARKLREAEAWSGALSEGRVRVVVRPDVGGVEGRGLLRHRTDLWLVGR